jgi:hypothetical protein
MAECNLFCAGGLDGLQLVCLIIVSCRLGDLPQLFGFKMVFQELEVCLKW